MRKSKPYWHRKIERCIEGVSEPDLKPAQAAYRALLGMGKKILPELIVGLGERKPAPYPVGEVESLLFDLEGQLLVIEYIANGKLKSTGFKAVENMFEYEAIIFARVPFNSDVWACY
jgi:hypothetical protein